MYQVGDKVVYGIHGVCQIVDHETQVVDRKRIPFLVLEPMGQEGSRYMVPTNSEAAMAKLRSVLSREELESLLHCAEIRENVWIADENQRKQRYRELISCGDRMRLMRMVHTLYRHKHTQTAAGKKVHLCDDNFLRDAEKLLASEFSIVLEMEPEQAKQYLRTQLKSE